MTPQGLAGGAAAAHGQNRKRPFGSADGPQGASSHQPQQQQAQQPQQQQSHLTDGSGTVAGDVAGAPGAAPVAMSKKAMKRMVMEGPIVVGPVVVRAPANEAERQEVDK